MSRFVIEEMRIEPDLVIILSLIFVFFILKGVAKFFEGFVRVKYQQFFMRRIRITNIDLLNSYDYRNFVKADVGRIQNTFTGEVERINNAFKFYFKAFQYGVLVLVYVILAFTADPVFSIVVATGGLATNFIFKMLYRKTKRFSAKITLKNHLFQGMMIQRISFFKYLTTTGLNLRYSQRLKNNVYSLENLQLKLGFVDALLGALREPLIILVVIIAIYLQVVWIGDESSLVILSLLLLYRALTFFMGMQEQWNFFLGLSGSLDSMEKFTGELAGGKKVRGTKKFSGLKKNLELKKVGFHYDDQYVLEDISVCINKDEVVAVVGESGSGKTTFMNILSGLLLSTEGSYNLDGVPIEKFDLHTFKRFVGYIPQDSAIFDDSIFNNVTLWDEKDSDTVLRFRKVLEKASLLKFVDQLPEKEDTLLGNNGINLSGGQKQRICIARELYKEVQLLLMDEATSALDSKTEVVIQKNIADLKGHFTMVVIAHRLATIKNADKILLLQNGRIGATGTFEELLETSPEFKEMIKLQNL